MSTTSTVPAAAPAARPLPADNQPIRRFFETIAGRYDLLNHLLSFRLDESWRKHSLNTVLEGHEKTILDLGAGTGKFLKQFLDKQRWQAAIGLDFSSNMLSLARRQLGRCAEYVSGDFHYLPFRGDFFDLVVSSFALRSVKNLPLFLSEVSRILKPGGKAAFLCLTRPRSRFWNLLYVPYLRYYLPFMGGLISGNRDAYKFLADSIMSFQEPEETAAMMRAAGFSAVSVRRFSLGMATLIYGRKPQESGQ